MQRRGIIKIEKSFIIIWKWKIENGYFRKKSDNKALGIKRYQIIICIIIQIKYLVKRIEIMWRWFKIKMWESVIAFIAYLNWE